MYFREKYVIKSLHLNLDEGTEKHIEFGSPHSIRVILRRPSGDEQVKGYKTEDVFCTVESQVEPSPHVNTMFECLADRRLPKGSKPFDKPLYPSNYLDDKGNIKEKHIIPVEILPQPFQSFVSTVQNELRDYAKRTVCLFRWRFAGSGPHNPFIYRGIYWSFEGDYWHSMPTSGRVFLSAHRWLRASDRHISEVVKLVNRDLNEPLGHELYREAWSQRHTNPRSSLVMGIAAAEIGFKECVGILIPNAQWLIENVPSPPLVRMLREYLPELPTRNKLADVLPSSILDILQKGVIIRNQITHGRSATLNYDTLEAVLLAVRDLLYIFDYYNGFDWAIEHIRATTLDAIGS